MSADLVEQAVTFLLDKCYPENCTTDNAKRSIRRKVVKEVKYVRSLQERERIMRACHMDPTSGHMGVKRTIYRVTERFFWKGVTKDVEKIVSVCDHCQKNTKKLEITRPELHPVPVHSPWFHVGIDFVGPISPTSKSGNRYILTLSDYFSKWVEAIPLPTKEAPGVAFTLFKIFMRMGIPRILTTDQGSEFKNSLNKEMMQLLKIKYHLTTAYHPQANGLDERFNQTLQNMLCKYVQDKKEDWDTYLDTCVCLQHFSPRVHTLYSIRSNVWPENN